MEQQIWSQLCNARFKGYCLSILVKKFQKRDRNINLIIALASSTSVGAWAVWNVVPMLWAIIIALSQVLVVIKPYFPYFKYVKILNDRKLKMDSVILELEKLWYKVQNDKLSEDEYVELFFTLRGEMANILTFGDDVVFEVSDSVNTKANEQMQVYLKSNYGIEINI